MKARQSQNILLSSLEDSTQNFTRNYHPRIVRIYTGGTCAQPLSISPTFSPGLLAALLDLPAADSSQGNEQHQQTYSQANSYPQSHRRERNVLTWSRKGRGRKSLIIHSCSAKIRAQLSPLYPSLLLFNLTILLLEFLVIKNLNYTDCRTTKAQHDDTNDDYCHHRQHCHIDSTLGLTFKNSGTVRENRYECENELDVSRVRVSLLLSN